MARCEYSFYQGSDRCRIKEKLKGESTDKVGSDTFKNFCSYSDGHKKCPFYEAYLKETKSGDCYLTSACMESRGLLDDCEELMTLRWFREDWLRNQSYGEEVINEYRRIAPRIVAEIKAKDNSGETFEEIYDHMVEPCVKLIKNGKMEEAYRLYKQITEEFKQRFNVIG